MPSTTVASSSAPHCPQTFAQYGSPLKRPSIIRSLPDAVASDVTSIERMRMASASPTSAPSTAPGSVPSCPPLMAGVITGPQQPGAVLATMCPPSRTVPTTSALGPMMPSQKRSTYTVSAAVATAGRDSMVAMRRSSHAGSVGASLRRERGAGEHRREHRRPGGEAQRAAEPGDGRRGADRGRAGERPEVAATRDERHRARHRGAVRAVRRGTEHGRGDDGDDRAEHRPAGQRSAQRGHEDDEPRADRGDAACAGHEPPAPEPHEHAVARQAPERQREREDGEPGGGDRGARAALGSQVHGAPVVGGTLDEEGQERDGAEEHQGAATPPGATSAPSI